MALGGSYDSGLHTRLAHLHKELHYIRLVVPAGMVKGHHSFLVLDMDLDI